MNHLAIDTSGRSGAVALLSADQLVAEELLPADLRTTQTLAPAIHRLTARLDRGCGALQLISVVSGPGSFTGLRIGVTTAKTLAYASQASLVTINTLEVLAFQAFQYLSSQSVQTDYCVATAIKAYRGQVYSALWRPTNESRLEAIEPPEAEPLEVWKVRVLDRGAAGNCWITGDACERIAVQETGEPRQKRIPEPLWQISASSVGRLGWLAFSRGQRDDFWKLEPNYLRPSAAEEV